MAPDQTLQRALQGDRDALNAVCEREWRAVYLLLYRYVQNREEAQDLTQEVFARALRSLDRYRVTETPFRGYLATIARNLLRDRWKQRRPAFHDIDTEPHLASPNPGPEALSLLSLEREDIQRGLDGLPEDYRTVLRMRLIERRSSDEVARLMGRKPDAIRQLQRRALLALRASLGEAIRA
jgi:RNA polymerase sigma-70 factor (ECF subfamily)